MAWEDETIIRKKDETIILDDYSTANVTYICKAVVGSQSYMPVWKIMKMDETAGIVITFADGDNKYDNIADNRTSLTYA